MFKKSMLNLMYSVGMAGSLFVGYLAFEQKNFWLVFPAMFALVFFVMQKVKLLKEIKNMPKPDPNNKP